MEGVKVRSRILCVASVLGLVAAIVLTATVNVDAIEPRLLVSLALSLFGMVVIFVLQCVDAMDENFSSSRERTVLNLLLLCTFFELFFDVCFDAVVGQPALAVLLFFVETMFLALSVPMVCFFYLYVDSLGGGKTKALDAAIAVLAAMACFLLILNCFHPVLFYVSDLGDHERAATYPVWLVIAYAMVLVCLVKIAKTSLPPSQKAMLFAYLALPMLAVAAQDCLGTVYLQNAAEAIAILLVYAGVYLKRGKSLAQREMQLSLAKVRLASSQIRPHFIFNVLSSVIHLCKDEAASSLVMDFSDYLRANYQMLGFDGLVPASQEMEHVKCYVRIERVRFEERVSVVYDIDSLDFDIPPLTIQPIVENAIKYGVCQRVEGGTVCVSVKESPDSHVITVVDDGVGFEVRKVELNGVDHAGIANVRERLEQMVGGTLSIESEPGVGTSVSVVVPKAERGLV